MARCRSERLNARGTRGAGSWPKDQPTASTPASRLLPHARHDVLLAGLLTPIAPPAVLVAMLSVGLLTAVGTDAIRLLAPVLPAP